MSETAPIQLRMTRAEKRCWRRAFEQCLTAQKVDAFACARMADAVVYEYRRRKVSP